MAQPTVAFRAWLKDSMNMKLSSDASVLHLTKEGITNFESLTDFDKKSLECLPATIKEPIDAIVADVPNNIYIFEISVFYSIFPWLTKV